MESARQIASPRGNSGKDLKPIAAYTPVRKSANPKNSKEVMKTTKEWMKTNFCATYPARYEFKLLAS